MNNQPQRALWYLARAQGDEEDRLHQMLGKNIWVRCLSQQRTDILVATRSISGPTIFVAVLLVASCASQPPASKPSVQAYKCYVETKTCTQKLASVPSEKRKGLLTKNEIMEVIEPRIGEIQRCYGNAMSGRDKFVAGKVIVEWEICSDGNVGTVEVKGTLPDRSTACCMLGVISTWKFEKPRNDGIVIVKFPFIFNML